MEKRRGFGERASRLLGMGMMIAWTLVLGPIGALFLGGVAYSMYAQSLAIGITCGLIFFSALLITLAWVPFIWTGLVPKAKRKVSSREHVDALQTCDATTACGFTSALGNSLGK